MVLTQRAKIWGLIGLTATVVALLATLGLPAGAQEATKAAVQAVATEPAVATTPVASPDTVIRWGQVMEPILLSIGSALGLILSGIALAFLKRIGVDTDLQTQEKVRQAAQTSAQFGVNYVKVKLDSLPSVDVKSESLAHAIKYFKDKWPDLVKNLGWTDDDIEKAIIARFDPESVKPVG